jgi:hypothetical protein
MVIRLSFAYLCILRMTERHPKFNPDGSQGKLPPRHNIILSGVPGIGEDILKQEDFPKKVWRRT